MLLETFIRIEIENGREDRWRTKESKERKAQTNITEKQPNAFSKKTNEIKTSRFKFKAPPGAVGTHVTTKILYL